MAKFAHDEVVPYSNKDEGKKKQVAEMFNKIAHRYDFINRLLSAGTDISWRKKAIAEIKTIQPKTILDVATGTGDMAIMMCKILQPESITGIDISEGMLEYGRKKIAAQGFEHMIDLQSGDAETINFPDKSFDAVTVAFGVRNFENLENGLREMHRVLKPGGKLMVLEFSRPKRKIFRGLYNFYMKKFAPAAGKVFCNNPEAYSYLGNSVRLFPEREQFTNIMKEAGYENIYFKTLSLGICCIYCGNR